MPSDRLAIIRDLGTHAGRAEHLEFEAGGEVYMTGKMFSSFRQSQVVYSRFHFCKLVEDLDYGDDGLPLDYTLHLAFSSGFKAALQADFGRLTIPVLAKRATDEYGQDCDDFIQNAPDWISQNPVFGPYVENPTF